MSYKIDYNRYNQQDTKIIPNDIKLAPVNKSVRFDPYDINDALIAAARMSQHYNQTYIVSPTAYGYNVFNEGKYAIPFGHPFFKVTGRTVVRYSVDLQSL